MDSSWGWSREGIWFDCSEFLIVRNCTGKNFKTNAVVHRDGKD